MLAYYQPIYERVEVNMSVSREGDGIDLRLGPTRPKEVVYYLPEEEIAYGPACYLWDYLRRSKQAGFFLPLSGGIDSCAIALIVHSMTRLVFEAIQSRKDPKYFWISIGFVVKKMAALGCPRLRKRFAIESSARPTWPWKITLPPSLGMQSSASWKGICWLRDAKGNELRTWPKTLAPIV
jgi:hypothetical protein